MEVIVGTYNHVLFGFTFQFQESGEKKGWQFKALFTDQGHAGCVKSVSTGGRYLASGSTDETIRLFDMKKHVEVGTLVQQDGSITCLVFCGSSHMLSGSDDGTICIWKSKTWELEKVLKGHRGGINCISLHPSGRLALSVSKDKNIKTWNLLTGRAAYTTNIKEVGEIVQWSPKGDTYAIVVGCRVTVYKISGVHEPIVYTCEKYILAMAFVNDSVLLLAGECDDIILYNFDKKLVLQRIAAHKVRTKSVCLVRDPNEEDKLLLFTVASDGNLKAWSLNTKDLTEAASQLASLDLPGRPTCMCVKLPPVKQPVKVGAIKKMAEQAVKVDAIKKMVEEVNDEELIEDLEENEQHTDEMKDSTKEITGDSMEDATTELTVEEVTADSMEDSRKGVITDYMEESKRDPTTDSTEDSKKEVAADSIEDSAMEQTSDSMEDSKKEVAADSMEESKRDHTTDSTEDSKKEVTADSIEDSAMEQTSDSIEDSKKELTTDSMESSNTDHTTDSIEDTKKELTTDSMESSNTDSIEDSSELTADSTETSTTSDSIVDSRNERTPKTGKKKKKSMSGDSLSSGKKMKKKKNVPAGD